MNTYEAFTIVTPHDAELAHTAGLPSAHLDIELCANCGAEVAHKETGFVAYTLILHADDSHHHLCMSCSAPVTHPRS
jgi:hypothetical protein